MCFRNIRGFPSAFQNAMTLAASCCAFAELRIMELGVAACGDLRRQEATQWCDVSFSFGRLGGSQFLDKS